MKKRIKAMVISLSVVGVLILTVLVYYFGAFYPTFNKVSDKEFDIPGLSEGFVPQGLDYIQEEDVFLISGYMADGSPSRVYVIDGKTGETQKYVTLVGVKGEDYLGHAGGVCHAGNSLWVVGDKKLNHISLSDVLSSSSAAKVDINAEIETGNGCDFISVINGKVVVGEFYRKKAYETNLSHHIDVGDGKINHALCYVYDINSANASGLEDYPCGAISVPNEIQGMTTTKDGKLLLSASYSIPSSRILIFDNVFLGAADGFVNLNGKDIPLYILSEKNLIKKISAPSMSEEVVLAGDKVYVLFESACVKYKAVNRTRIKNVYSVNI